MIGVVLAAGKGSRLGNYTTDLPKSLLPLNDNNDSLLDYNLSLLSQFNLDKIIIVTGFNSGKIEAHVKKYDDIEIVYNPFWDHCNVLGSLYMALKSIDDDFLFLHADTLADRGIWDNLIKAEGEMVLPFERKQCCEEEMKMLLKDNKVVQITKEMDADLADGEFLGEHLFKKGELNHYMESVIQEAINENMFNITAMDILHHNFVEVDFEEDYERAKKEFGN